MKHGEARVGRRIQGVLFDLDGTLVDTAPDLLAALAVLCDQQGRATPSLQTLRQCVSKGAAGMIAMAFDKPATEAMIETFLSHYHRHCWRHSVVFPGMMDLVKSLHVAAVPMAVVTNKVTALAEPVLAKSGLLPYFSSVIAGDTTPHPKPAPDPVLAACEALAIEPNQTILVGDDQRDVTAAHASGGTAAIAAWGYLPSDGSAQQWGAEYWLDSPAELMDLISAKAGDA